MGRQRRYLSFANKPFRTDNVSGHQLLNKTPSILEFHIVTITYIDLAFLYEGRMPIYLHYVYSELLCGTRKCLFKQKSEA